jgi:nitrogen fixation/metabolism regulation signal transduction histidine kinase
MTRQSYQPAAVSFAGLNLAHWQWAAWTLTQGHSHTRGAAQKDPSMSETQGQFNGIRGFLWLVAGFLLLLAAIGSAIYIGAHLLKYL